MASPLQRTLATAAALAALAACSHNPQFRMNLANQTYAALNELYVLLAEADLGTLRSPASYPGAADSYAAILGGFQIGGLLASNRPPGPASAKTARLDHLDSAVRRCVGQVRRMSDLHRTTGIAPGSPTIGTVRASCDAAARSVAAEEVSSWVFSTVAGDL